MKNKIFIVLLVLATIMVFGIMAENARTVTAPEEAGVEIDTSSVKAKIQKAGIVPRDAMHWKEL